MSKWQMSDKPIFMVDELVAKPGRASALRSSYLADYVPAAAGRGLTLCHSWISPPLLLGRDQSNTLTFIWSVTGTAGWWKMRHGALSDSSVGLFWDSVEPLIERRARRFHAESTDV